MVAYVDRVVLDLLDTELQKFREIAPNMPVDWIEQKSYNHKYKIISLQDPVGNVIAKITMKKTDRGLIISFVDNDFTFPPPKYEWG